MVVVQYLAPRDLASFIQRKGRGGRQIGTRPVMATVLSPYRPVDVFYFRNPHLLSDPTFRRLPLNPANALARQIHGVYGILDWIANQTAAEVKMDYLNGAAWGEVRRLSASAEALDAYRRYLAGVFGVDPDDRGLLAALIDPQRGLYGAILPELDDAVTGRAANGAGADGGARSRRLPDLLPRRIPPTLFSDILCRLPASSVSV